MLEDQTEKGLFYMDERALIMEMEDAVDRLYGEGTYKEALKYHLKAYPEFTKNWLKKAAVNVNDMIDHDHLDEVNTFYDTGNKMMSAYDDKYGVPELKNFLILLENLDDEFFEKEISDKSFSYLFAKYGFTDFDAIEHMFGCAPIGIDAPADKDFINDLIEACDKYEKMIADARQEYLDSQKKK